MQCKEGYNFPVARLFRQLSKRLSVCSCALAKCRKAFQKSRYPPGIANLNGVSEICQLDAEVAASLPQILDCPTGWRSAKLPVSAVDFRASVEQQLDDFAKPIKRGVVKCCCAGFVAFMHKFAVFVQDCPDLIHIT